MKAMMKGMGIDQEMEGEDEEYAKLLKGLGIQAPGGGEDEELLKQLEQGADVDPDNLTDEQLMAELNKELKLKSPLEQAKEAQALADQAKKAMKDFGQKGDKASAIAKMREFKEQQAIVDNLCAECPGLKE